MRTLSVIARVLLGVLFVVFGLNGFLHFLPQPPLPAGPATQFFMALGSTNYIVVVFALQLVGGALLLANRYVPLAVTLLGPVIVNIVLYHVTMDMKGIAPGLIVSILWLVVFASVKSAFAGIFEARADGELKLSSNQS